MVRVMVRVAFAIAGLLLAGCSSGEPAPRVEPVPVEKVEPSFLDDTTGTLPADIGELGLYPDLENLARTHPRAHRFEPAFPLWSNGSTKDRFVVVPAGERIDTSVSSTWTFPIGTLFLKTFAYPVPGDGDSVRPVETRVLQLKEAGWEFAVYLWDEAGRSAALLDITRPTPVAVEAFGERFEHMVPAKLDCRKCHESALGAVLGFREVQLAHAVDAAPSELARLSELALFSEAVREEPERIAHEAQTTAEVLRYFQGNCVHCHNGGPPPAAFDLRHEVALENLIGRETEGELLASGVRVVPGEPESSVVFLTLARRAEISGILPMPPVGVQRTDTGAVELFRGWIAGLAPAGE
jgi:hypothetical protein